MKVQVIRRTVEMCANCGGWDPFRKGRCGTTCTSARTGVKRVYGKCRHCGAKIIIQYVRPPENTAE